MSADWDFFYWPNSTNFGNFFKQIEFVSQPIKNFQPFKPVCRHIPLYNSAEIFIQFVKSERFLFQNRIYRGGFIFYPEIQTFKNFFVGRFQKFWKIIRKTFLNCPHRKKNRMIRKFMPLPAQIITIKIFRRVQIIIKSVIAD